MGNSKYGYLIKNTYLFTISSFSSKLLNFLLVPLYTNILSTSDYGMADLLTTTTNLLLFIVTINIADAVLRFVIEREDKGEQIFGYGIRVILKGNFCFALILCLFAFFNPIKWDWYLYLFLFLNVFFSSFLNITSYYLRAIDKIKTVAIGGILSTLITILFNIITLIVIKIGIIGYLISMIAGSIFTTIYYFLKCNGVYHAFINSTKDKNVQRSMLKYCIPLILNGVAWWVSASLDKCFIVFIVDISANGVYSVAQKIPSILTIVSSIFLQAWNISAIKEFNRDDNDGFFSNTYKLVNTALVIGCSCLILFNIPLAKILYAKEFYNAWKCSSWLLISIVFSSMSSFAGSIFAAVKNTRIASVSTIVSAVINAILNFILIPLFETQGAAIATVISFFFVWLIRYILLKKYIVLRNSLPIDILAYVLLVCQVILEKYDGHCYLGQICIFVIIIMCYKSNIKDVFISLQAKINSFRTKN